MNATEDFVSVRAFYLDLVNARLVRVELERRKRQAIALDSCTECDGPLKYPLIPPCERRGLILIRVSVFITVSNKL